MTITAYARRPSRDLDGRPNLVDALNREWRDRYERRLVPAPGGWASDARLGAYRYVVEALAELDGPATPPDRVEQILAALAQRAADGDTEAGRTVVQYLLPYLVAVLGRPRVSTTRSRDETLDDLVAAAWQAVAVGVESLGRPTRIALLRNIEYWALWRPFWTARRDASREVFADDRPLRADLWGRPDGAGPSAEEEVSDLLAEAARAGLSPADVALLGAMTRGARASTEMGPAEGVTARAIRYRRAAAVRRLAQWAA